MLDKTRSATANIVQRCEDIFTDLNFEVARAWKAAKPGRKVIGFMPYYVPRELIHAAGALPLGILGGGDQLEVIHGDAYYQSYICRIPRSTIELGVSGRLDFVDGMLFPSICDVIRNLSGMWKLMFPDKGSRYVDLPQNFEDDVGGEFYRSELNEIREWLANITGRPVTDEAIRASIVHFNENRRLVREAYALRAKEPWNVPSAELYLLLRAGLVLPVEDHNQLMRDYLASVRDQQRPIKDNCRVVVSGVFCEQPPLNLIKSIELSGCYIVDDDFILVTRWEKSEVATDGDPIANLARSYLHDSTVDLGEIRAGRTQQGHVSRRQRAREPRRRRHLRDAELLRPGVARAADVAKRSEEARRPPNRVQICREFRPDAAHSRTGRNFRRTRSNSGVEQHDHYHAIQSQAGRNHQGRFDDEAERDDERALRAAVQRAGARRESRGDVRSGQSQRIADVLRLRQQSAGGQRDPERSAQDQRWVRHGSRKARPFRGRLHLCEVRHRHDGQGQYRTQRAQAPGSGRAAAVLHRLLHLHEMVRTAAPAIPQV